VTLDAEQLEWVVREVVRRLRDVAISVSSNGATPRETPPEADAHITLADALITTSTLENRLDGVSRVTVAAKAIVTPSVRDLLRERQIELVRLE
jgi:hypothetical protein